MVIAAVVNIFLAFFMRREAERSHSMALRAEAKHLRTNVVQAGTIIAGLMLVAVTGKEMFDPLFALGLAAYMGWIAYGLVRIAAAESWTHPFPMRTWPSSMMCSSSTANTCGASIACAPAAPARTATSICTYWSHSDLTVEQVHPISESIEHEIEERLPGTIVVIHVEPDDGLHKEEFENLVHDRTN